MQPANKNKNLRFLTKICHNQKKDNSKIITKISGRQKFLPFILETFNNFPERIVYKKCRTFSPALRQPLQYSFAPDDMYLCTQTCNKVLRSVESCKEKPAFYRYTWTNVESFCSGLFTLHNN